MKTWNRQIILHMPTIKILHLPLNHLLPETDRQDTEPDRFVNLFRGTILMKILIFYLLAMGKIRSFQSPDNEILQVTQKVH